MREERGNKKVGKEWTTVGSHGAGEILVLGDYRARKMGGWKLEFFMCHHSFSYSPFQLTCLTAVPHSASGPL